MPFQILFEDEYFIAINKPPGILVHRTKISEDQVFVLQLLRNQIRKRVYPIHRLDRGTSGVLIFGKSKEAASKLSENFRNLDIEKTYLAIVRGYVKDEETIDYEIAKEKGKPLQNAVTHYKKLTQTELQIPVGRYPTARYSYVEIHPKTGRFHQIRKHFSHIRHPVINCKKHGDVKHNKFFKNELGIERLLLHASALKFTHPVDNEEIIIKAELEESFSTVLEIFNADWND